MITALFARKYLFSRNSRSVVNIIAGVSVGAVAVPVAAMIVLLSVFNGFESVIRGMRSACDADLTVMPARGATFAAEEIDMQRLTEQLPNIEAFSFSLEQGALLEYAGNRMTARVRGVDGCYNDVTDIDSHTAAGLFEMQRGDDVDNIALGMGLARTLGIRSVVIDDVTLYALGHGTFSTLLPVSGISSRTLPVKAVFAVDARTDAELAYTSLRAAQELFGLEGRVSALNIRLKEGSSAEAAARQTALVAGSGFRVLTRDELNASTYRLVRYEKWGVFIIAALVLLVASLSIVGVLAMLVIEKRRDTDTLRIMGADTALLRSIFVAEGVLICSIGGAAGLATGIAAVLAQQYLKIITIPARTLLIDAYPVELHAGDVLLTAALFSLTAWGLSQITVRSMLKRQS